MGRIIKINTWEGELPDALTQAGRSGFLSSGYLADEPAQSVVEADEKIQFVLTNRKRGVRVEAGGASEQVTPDGRYRTVAVVTDRRLVVLVGRAQGDERTEIPLADVTEVDTERGRRAGQVIVDRPESTWHIHTDTDGLDAVATYLGDATEAWREVESLLGTVESKLEQAASLQSAAEFDRALAVARSTKEYLSSARAAARQFTTDYPGTALQDRLAAVETRQRRTEAAVLVARARDATDVGERLSAEKNYEAAREAYERAREEYDAALSVAGDELADVERIRDERARVDRVVTRLRESPLREAIEADKAAVAAEDPDDVADHWETALERYEHALEKIAGTADSRAMGDPDRIRERMTTVAESLTATQRTVGNDAMRAGDWYADTGQYEAAMEEFDRATEALGAALATAKEYYPDAVDHLQTERAALAQRIDRVEATLDGDDLEDHIDADSGGTDDVDLSVGTVEEPATIGDPTEIEESIDLSLSDPDSLPESTAGRLRDLDRESLTAVAADALDRTDLAVQDAPEKTPFDLFARQGDRRLGIVIHAPDEGVLTDGVVTHCAEVCGAAGTDGVVLVTTGHVPTPIEQLAEEQDVRLLRTESLAAIVDTENLTVPAPH